MLPRMQAYSPKHIQLRCCHHNINLASETAAHIDNFNCGVLERVFLTSVAFHTVSSACAQYYNEVSERGASTLRRALSKRTWWCHRNMDPGLLRRTLLTNGGMIRLPYILLESERIPVLQFCSGQVANASTMGFGIFFVEACIGNCTYIISPKLFAQWLSERVNSS